MDKFINAKIVANGSPVMVKQTEHRAMFEQDKKMFSQPRPHTGS